MFAMGKQYGAFFCEINQNDFHKNIAYLIVMGNADDITVVDRSGTTHRGSAFLINPLVEHTLRGLNPAWNIFLAPHSAFAVSLDKFANDIGISKLPLDALPFHGEMPGEEIFKVLDRVMAESNLKIDPRLAAVLDDLGHMSTQMSLTEIAKQYGLSPSRLRVIAKEQIGIPLSMLLVWRKAIKSMKALSAGATLSEAAHAGGFSDQAHFTRTIRKMFGITPSTSMQAFRYEK